MIVLSGFMAVYLSSSIMNSVNYLMNISREVSGGNLTVEAEPKTADEMGELTAAYGEAMGEYIEAKLDLKNGAGPFNMEVFAGDTADNNAHLFFSAAMEVLKPYIANGQLVVPSGETSFDQATTQGWNPDNAQKRMERLLQGADAGVHLDVILSPNDGVAGGVRKALTAGGYTQMPLITGQDAEEQAIAAIKAGQQAMTTYKDPEILVAKSIRMIKAVVEGTQPDINNVTTYNNGVITVPAYLCTPLVVDAGNINVVK